MWLVGHHGGVPNKEWLTKISVNEIKDRLHGLLADHQARIAVTPFGGHAVGKTAVRVMPFPELPCLESSVSSFLEQARHCRGIPQEGRHGTTVHAFRGVIATNPVSVSVEA